MSSFDGGTIFFDPSPRGPITLVPCAALVATQSWEIAYASALWSVANIFRAVGTVTPSLRSRSRNSPTDRAVSLRFLDSDPLQQFIDRLVIGAVRHWNTTLVRRNAKAFDCRSIVGAAQYFLELWQFMGDAQADPVDKVSRWHKVAGPLFQSIWPLDARLRSQDTTRYLVLMALECQGAFSEAVDAIINLIVPYELHEISISLKFEDSHRELVHQDPLSFLKLTNALIDATLFSIPNDLADFLQECVAADPTVVAHPAYVRLNGLRRQRNA